MQIGQFTLANADKVERAINGTVLDKGSTKGGVGPNASEDEIIAEYDRLGGLILMGRNKVRMGCFYDFKSKKAFAKPKPYLVFNVNGETVEVDASKPLPIEVQAAEIADARKLEKAEAAEAKRVEKAAAKKSGKKGSKKEEVEEGEEDEEEGELA